MTVVKDSISASSEQRVGELVREIRTRQGMSLRTLAGRAGFSPSFSHRLSAVRPRPPSHRWSGWPGRSASRRGTCFATRRPPSSRAGERETLSRCRGRTPRSRRSARLVRDTLLRRSSSAWLRAQSGGRPYSHSGDEFAIVFEGDVRLTLNRGNPPAHSRRRGDVSSETQHHWENAGSDLARVVVVSAR